MVRIMLYYKSMQVNANTIYGEDSYYKYYPTLLYSVLPAVATMAFEPIAAALNKFEGHTTKVTFTLSPRFFLFSVSGFLATLTMTFDPFLFLFRLTLRTPAL